MDRAFWMLDMILVVDCFHFCAPIFAFCLMTLSSSVMIWSFLALSSRRCCSCSSVVGPKQQQYHFRPSHALMLGQKHLIASAMTTKKAMMQASRMRKGMERKGWNASYVNSAFVGTSTSRSETWTAVWFGTIDFGASMVMPVCNGYTLSSSKIFKSDVFSVVFDDGVENLAPVGRVMVQEYLKIASPIPRMVTDSSLYRFDKLLSEHLMYNLVSRGTE